MLSLGKSHFDVFCKHIKLHLEKCKQLSDVVNTTYCMQYTEGFLQLLVSMPKPQNLNDLKCNLNLWCLQLALHVCTTGTTLKQT